MDNIQNLLGMAQTAAIGGNNQEALLYYNRVLEIDPTRSEAWLGKGKSAAWQSTLLNIRLPEALIAFNHAIANAPAGQESTVTTEAVTEVNRIAVALYGLARNHLIEFANVGDTWQSYLNQIAQLIDALDTVRQWQPADRNTLDNIVHFCKDNIEGYNYRDTFNNNAPAAHSITPSYERLLRTRMDMAVEAIRAADPTYAVPTIEKKKADACFVVTATMGDHDHPQVVLLRRLRDEWICQRPGGRLFIAVYYLIGPWLASFVEQSAMLRRGSYRLIVRPAVRFAKGRLSAGGSE